MKVKCISNTGKDLPEKALDREPYGTLKKDKNFTGITIGRTYIVYGFAIRVDLAWYYICDDGYKKGDYMPFPLWYPSPFFEIVDRRLSKYWEFDSRPGERCESLSGVIVAFPEWANDPFYYDRLTDGFQPEVALFRKYKKLIDEEYPDILAN